MNYFWHCRMPMAVLLFITVCIPSLTCAQAADSSITIRIDTGEADAVLAILAKRAAARPIEDGDWAKLFSSEGYQRLKKREISMKRDFSDDAFKVFVMSDTLPAQAKRYSETLRQWQQTDMKKAGGLALLYLPDGARIRATIYPVIKPKTNSFVFETSTDPAIFLFLNPGVSRQKFENTLIHELHHIGLSGEALHYDASRDTTIDKNVRTMLEWASAFGEGEAMLAAAGGPDVYPHTTSRPEDRARWDNDMKNFGTDLKTVEQFFNDVLDSRLSDGEMQTKGMSFFGVQGPWYTVGWKMASTIEKTFGRPKLIECICNPALLLVTYNQAAILHNRQSQDTLVLWDQSLLERIEMKKPK
jgi:hypothetical protein